MSEQASLDPASPTRAIGKAAKSGFGGMLQMRSPLSAAKSVFGSPGARKQGYHQLKDSDFGSPSLSPYRLPQMGVLEVHVQCADGLRAADSNGKSDPYAKVSVGKKDVHKRQTKVSLTLALPHPTSSPSP